jgi:hypothetical protein
MASSPGRTTARRTSRLLGRPGLLVAALLVLPALLASAVPAAADADAAEAASRWLVDQLVDGERLEVSFPDADGNEQVFVDHGGTADVVLALAATGVAPDAAHAALDWLVAEAPAYTGAAFEAPFAGATAKLALTVLAGGRDPRAVGDLDLVGQLGALEVSDGPDAGRFADAGDEDWSSTFSQALSIIALERTDGVSPSDAARGFLLAQRCDDGSFRFEPGVQPCEGHVDTTALAVQALVAIGEDPGGSAVWLRGRQDPDGGFGNANSTGLAAAALSLAGEQDAAADARAYLVDLQDHCDVGEGAIGFDHDCAGDPVFATRQAVLGLVGASLADITLGDDVADATGTRPLALAAVVVVGLAIGVFVRRRARA